MRPCIKISISILLLLLLARPAASTRNSTPTPTIQCDGSECTAGEEDEAWYENKAFALNKKLIEMIDSVSNKALAKELKELLGLPEIVVVGSQSAGKSTTLEMFAGLNFLPRGPGTCTTRPFRITLNPTKNEAASFEVYERNETDKKVTFTDKSELADHLAKLNSKAKEIKADPVNVEVYFKDIPVPITLLDLPGALLFEAGKDTSMTECRKPGGKCRKIEDIIEYYAVRDSAIILNVHNGMMDFSADYGMTLGKKYDPTSSRTVGVIAKTDTGWTDSDLRDPKNEDGILSTLEIHPNFFAITGQKQETIKDGVPVSKTIKEEEFFFNSVPELQPYKGRLGTPALRKELARRFHKEILRKMRLFKMQGSNFTKALEHEKDLLKEMTPPPPTDANIIFTEYLQDGILEPWQEHVELKTRRGLAAIEQDSFLIKKLTEFASQIRVPGDDDDDEGEEPIEYPLAGLKKENFDACKLNCGAPKSTKGGNTNNILDVGPCQGKLFGAEIDALVGPVKTIFDDLFHGLFEWSTQGDGYERWMSRYPEIMPVLEQALKLNLHKAFHNATAFVLKSLNFEREIQWTQLTTPHILKGGGYIGASAVAQKCNQAPGCDYSYCVVKKTAIDLREGLVDLIIKATTSEVFKSIKGIFRNIQEVGRPLCNDPIYWREKDDIAKKREGHRAKIKVLEDLRDEIDKYFFFK